MINPYGSVDWGSYQKIQSLSHAHSHSQNLNVAFNSVKAWYDDGIRHFAYSNYYPSNPTYPIGSDDLWCRGVTADNVKYAAWKENITDLIESPNAEHHSIQRDNGVSVSRLHINGLGSTYSSGNPPGVTPVGCNIPWKTLFDNILSNLQYSDAGGVTINHPSWTKASTSSARLTDDDVFQMLDYDDRVLGIEIYNHSSETSEGNGWDLVLFDKILSTGRRCWCFAVPDHHYPGYTPSEGSAGRNVLLVPTITEYNCLKAYRDGNFYCQLYNTAFAFTNISYANGSLSVSVANADEITFVANGNQTTVSGNSAVFTVPLNAVYVRVQASGLGDMVFSNPIMLKDVKKKSNVSRKIVTLFD